jgi:hypothetical protein
MARDVEKVAPRTTDGLPDEVITTDTPVHTAAEAEILVEIATKTDETDRRETETIATATERRIRNATPRRTVGGCKVALLPVSHRHHPIHLPRPRRSSRRSGSGDAARRRAYDDPETMSRLFMASLN